VINEKIGRPVQVACSVTGGNGGGQLSPLTVSRAAGDGACADCEDIGQLILENCDENKPLLIRENNHLAGLPETIRSMMLVPLTIRDKVFGVLAV